MCVLNNEPSTIRLALTDLNPVDLNYFLFMVRLYRCNRSCNTVDDLFKKKICISSETKVVKIKIFNMITRINEAKTLVKHLSWDGKC